MTSKNKINRLKRITLITENNEKKQLINWKLAKDNLESAKEQLNQLQQYFESYASESNININANLYANKARILNMVREAVNHQQTEIDRYKRAESTQHELLKIKTQEKKINEKLTEKKEFRLLEVTKKQENIAAEEINLNYF